MSYVLCVGLLLAGAAMLGIAVVWSNLWCDFGALCCSLSAVGLALGEIFEAR